MYRVGQKGGLQVAVSCVLAASGRGASSHNLGSTFFGGHLATQRTSTSDVVSSSTGTALSLFVSHPASAKCGILRYPNFALHLFCATFYITRLKLFLTYLQEANRLLNNLVTCGQNWLSIPRNTCLRNLPLDGKSLQII